MTAPGTHPQGLPEAYNLLTRRNPRLGFNHFSQSQANPQRKAERIRGNHEKQNLYGGSYGSGGGHDVERR
jgi:hypothetical protein